MTEGNSHQRYIGVTDEPLCEEGRKLLEKFTYPAVQALFVSPLKRCRETASILFPKGEQRIVPLLAECDFGEFENKNYKELSDNPHYQKWIDSNGTLPFPGGESKEECADRNLKGFDEVLKACRDEGITEAALRDNKNCLRVFFCAPMENRMKRVMDRLHLSEKDAKQKIQKEDKWRADNYRYYTGRIWGASANFDLTVNTALGEEYIEICIREAMKR